MNAKKLHIILADDDPDDCIFFKDVLENLPLQFHLTTVNDGAELIYLLTTDKKALPDVLFLDLNMPRKSGFECLSEIKASDQLKSLPVIILSTSLDPEVANILYEEGAHYYIRKPGDYLSLKRVIEAALKIMEGRNKEQPARQNFILQP